jgi:hypothetical protein
MTDSQSMPGWGKLSEGQPYLPFAFDVGRAIFALGLGENVGSLLWHVLEVSWGSTPRVPGEWSDPVPCPLDCSELAERWGVHRNRLYEAKRWLMQARILKEVAGGVVVNKKVDSWIDPKGGPCPLLSPERLAWAEEGKARSRKRPPESAGHVAPLSASPVCGGAPLLPEDSCHVATLLRAEDCHGAPLLGAEDCHVAPPQEQRSNVAGPIEERAPGFEKEKKAKAAELSGNAAAASSPDPSGNQTSGKPTYPDERTPTKPGAFDPALDESRLFFDQLWEAYRSASLCREWWVERRQYDLLAWRAALAKITERGTVIRKVGYLALAAADWTGDPVMPSPSPSAARRRNAGVAPPPEAPPLSPERRAEIENGYKIRAARNRSASAARQATTSEPPRQAAARFLALVRSDGDTVRGLHAPESLTGT